MKPNPYLLFILFCLSGILPLSAQPQHLWSTGEIFKGPEAVVWDSIRDVLYISNYDRNIKNGTSYGDHFISRVDLQGNILEFKWITNLSAPTGMTIFKDKLYIVERFGIVEYDLVLNTVTRKNYIKTLDFLNDIAVGPDSSVYVTVSNSDVLYKIKNGQVEEWIRDKIIDQSNGILCDNNQLLVGVNSDNCLKSIDLDNKAIRTIAQLPEGNIDGIVKCEGGYLVSQYEGVLYYITQSGQTTVLLDKDDGIRIANFEYIPEKELLVFPTLYDKRVCGYRYKH